MYERWRKDTLTHKNYEQIKNLNKMLSLMSSKIRDNNSHFAAKDKLGPMNKKSDKI